jgi:hypothetical protein
MTSKSSSSRTTSLQTQAAILSAEATLSLTSSGLHKADDSALLRTTHDHEMIES